MNDPVRQIAAFTHVSLDGFYCDPQGDMSFAHQNPRDEEWNAFTRENAGSGNDLLMGRHTFDLMSGWWPSPMAAQAMPEVAESINRARKHVVSRTLCTETAEHRWPNSTVHGDLVTCARALRQHAGPPITVLGSGSVVRQLADAQLIDVLQLVVNPVALGCGRSLLGGLEHRLPLSLWDARRFRNGAVLLTYYLGASLAD